MKKILFLLVAFLCTVPMFAQLTGADEIGSVVIHERPLDDDHTMYNGTNFRDYGPTLTSGTSKFFGVKFNYDGTVNREADVRFALYNMDKEIVELYKPMRVNVLAGGVNGFVIPCQVNAPAGDYYVVPLFRWAGESDWTAVLYSIFHPDNDRRDKYLWRWKFTVIEDKLPLVKYVRKPEGLYTPKQGQKFDLKVRLSNPYNTAKFGRIKIMHERDMKKFNPGYSYNEEQSTEEFFDCMTTYATLNGDKPAEDGSFPVSIDSEGETELVFKNVVSYEDHGVYDQFAGQLNCYFLPDGKADKPENWIMLQEDCRSLFNGNDLKYTVDTEEYSYIVIGIESVCQNFVGFILIPDPTAVTDIQVSNVSLSYNHSTGNLHFDNVPEPCRISVVSLTGSVVMSETVKGDSSINMKVIPAGLYVLTMSDQKGELIKSLKLMIR